MTKKPVRLLSNERVKFSFRKSYRSFLARRNEVNGFDSVEQFDYVTQKNYREILN
jgi:hypothetical protein